MSPLARGTADGNDERQNDEVLHDGASANVPTMKR